MSAIVYGLSTPRWIVGGDNGEFVTLAATGGVAHPPGYPLYVLMLRAFAWVPIDPPRRAALVTAAIGGLSVAALHRAARAWGASPPAATIAAAAFASSSLAWRLCSSAEVFALNVLIACAIVIAAAPEGPARGWRRAMQLGLLAGLGLSNHHSIVLLAPVGIAGLVRAFREDRWMPCVIGSVGGLVAGLVPYAYLYASAQHANPDTAWIWGDIHDARTLFDHFRRAEFGTTRLALRDAPLEPLLQLRTFAAHLTTDLLGLPLIVVVATLLRVRRVRSPLAWLAASFLLAGPGFVAILNIAPRGVAALIVERFYLLPSALLAILAALSLDAMLPRLRERAGAAAVVAGCALAAGLALGAERVAEDHRPTVDDFVRNTLRIAPPRAIILASGDQKFSGFLYASRVLHLRPDVTFATPEMLQAEWYRKRLSARIGQRVEAAPGGNEARLVATLLATGRPVAFAGPVPDDVFGAGFHSIPFGTLQIIVPPHEKPPSADELEHRNLELLTEYHLETTAPPSRDTWAGATMGEYARSWLILERAFRADGETGRAAACHERAVAFAPWLR